MVIIHSIFQSVCVTVSIKAEALHNEIKHGEFFFYPGGNEQFVWKPKIQGFSKKIWGQWEKL